MNTGNLKIMVSELRKKSDNEIDRILFEPEMKMASGYFAYHGLVNFKDGTIVELQIYSSLMKTWRYFLLSPRYEMAGIQDYKWFNRQSKPYKYDELLAKIRQIRADNPDYGAHRIYLHLQLYEGYTGSFYVILKLCKIHHLMLMKKHHSKGITKADLAAQASANLIKQDFSAASPNQKWLGDITEIPTADGKLYVAAILDCFDGTIVGFKMANHMRAELCVEAFTAGVKKYQAHGMIFHSDRGSQLYKRDLPSNASPVWCTTEYEQHRQML